MGEWADLEYGGVSWIRKPREPGGPLAGMMTPTPGPWLARLLALLLVAIALAGCHDLGATTSEYGGSSRTEAADGAVDEGVDEVAEDLDAEAAKVPEPPELTVALGSFVNRSFVGQQLEIFVQVRGDNASADWVGVQWSRGSTGGLGSEQLRPDRFDGQKAALDDTRVLPGNFTVSLPLETAGVLFLRAHVVANDTFYWSPEASVTVVLPVEEGDFEADHTVNLRTNLLNPCQGDVYNPDPLEIQSGEVVRWVNAASCPHSATHAGDDRLWDTGVIEANSASVHNYRFNQPGSYEVHCTQHAGMGATIVVQ